MLQGRTEMGVGGVLVPVERVLLAPPMLVRTGWTIGGGATAWPGGWERERERERKFYLISFELECFGLIDATDSVHSTDVIGSIDGTGTTDCINAASSTGSIDTTGYRVKVWLKPWFYDASGSD